MTTLMTVRDTRRFALLTLIAGLAVLAGFLVLAPVTLANEHSDDGEVVTRDEQHGDCTCTYWEEVENTIGGCGDGCNSDCSRRFQRIQVFRDCFDHRVCEIKRAWPVCYPSPSCWPQCLLEGNTGMNVILTVACDLTTNPVALSTSASILSNLDVSIR